MPIAEQMALKAAWKQGQVQASGKKPEDKPARHSSYQNHLSKVAEVDSIVDELEKNNTSGQFSPEQLRAWAHMIQLNKHVSYDEPPDKPFFRKDYHLPKESH